MRNQEYDRTLGRLLVVNVINKQYGFELEERQ